MKRPGSVQQYSVDALRRMVIRRLHHLKIDMNVSNIVHKWRIKAFNGGTPSARPPQTDVKIKLSHTLSGKEDE